MIIGQIKQSTGKDIWRALIINGTFFELFHNYKDRLKKEGFGLVPIEDVRLLTPEKVHSLSRDVDVIFGPGYGLDGKLFNVANRLKVISLSSSGYDLVDIEEATRAGVVVTNAPTPLGSEAVADLTFGLIICVARKIPQSYHSLVSFKKIEKPFGDTVWGKTLGIVGLGNIGKAVAKRASGFNMRILAFDFHQFWDEKFASQYNIERVELEKLLKESDFVSLHLRETTSTKGIIGAKELSLMKPTAYLINTARASLVDEKAIYEALVTGKIAGASIDVLSKLVDNPLINLPNVVSTPHMGNRCLESIDDVINTAIDNALAVLHGMRPKFVVNPEVYEADRLKVKLPESEGKI